MMLSVTALGRSPSRRGCPFAGLRSWGRPAQLRWPLPPSQLRRAVGVAAADQQAGLWQDFKEWLGDTGGDPGHWNLSPQWWGTQGEAWGRDEGRTVFAAQSKHNGNVTVTAHDAVPLGGSEEEGLGVPEEWRVLRFNDTTRQSAARVKVAADGSVAANLACLAQEYLKSMACVSAAIMGLQHQGAQAVEQPLQILCIGVGGGALPLFLAHHFPAATVQAVEIDPVVVEAATTHMGFRELPNLQLHTCDAVDFLQQPESGAISGTKYDLILIDAFDGEDNTPAALCSEEFSGMLADALDPAKGALIMNVHGRRELGPAKEYYHAMRELAGNTDFCVCFTLEAKAQPNTALVIAYRLDVSPDPDLAEPRLREAAVQVAEAAGFPFRAKRRAASTYRRVLMNVKGDVMFLI